MCFFFLIFGGFRCIDAARICRQRPRQSLKWVILFFLSKGGIDSTIVVFVIVANVVDLCGCAIATQDGDVVYFCGWMSFKRTDGGASQAPEEV